VARKRVARLMRRHALRAVGRRKFRRTTDSFHRHPVAPNLLAQNFQVDAPNRVWVGDITYVWTLEGWAYLAVFLDLHSRRVIGWALRKSMSRELAIAALRNALLTRNPASGLIHHSRSPPFSWTATMRQDASGKHVEETQAS
jgi:putative transposase